MPVDWYLGGAEHAVLHLLYARFWHKFLYDEGYISTNEPFQKLSGIGLVLAEDGRKMSKRWGNVVTPDEITEDYGADTLRLYEAFMGPFENTIAWDPNGINGVHRFLHKIWTYQHEQSGKWSDNTPRETSISLNKTISKVTEDIANLKLNTAIAALMGTLNDIAKFGTISQVDWETYLLLLAPFAPHITEELWQNLGKSGSIHSQMWPQANVQAIDESVTTVAVQVNGKVRGTFEGSKSMNQEEAIAAATTLESVTRHLSGKEVVKAIYIPGKVLNLVIK